MSKIVCWHCGHKEEWFDGLYMGCPMCNKGETVKQDKNKQLTLVGTNDDLPPEKFGEEYEEDIEIEDGFLDDPEDDEENEYDEEYHQEEDDEDY